ncbi:MAG: hypothetical protein HAW58_01985 [Candidatus Thioglobus sp.]|nr:hypothetical protein [Candidatus Thioglobus sp.]
MKKFNLNEAQEIHNYYQEFGYVVIKNVISASKINRFLGAYQQIKKNRFFVYYSQSIHIVTKPILNEFSYIKESMQNASRLAFFKDFSKSFQQCIYAENVSVALSKISKKEKHTSWQNMFFDQSVGTVEHQDSWYLDTEPPGNLIGVWYALEDIHPDSGAFFVVPKSHKIGLLDRNSYPNHNDFVNATKQQIAKFGVDKKAMCLQKGDILLWHPYLVHGAFQAADESKSRKSFTAHFYPSEFKAKDTEKSKILSIYDHKNPKKTENKNIYSAYKFNDYFYNILVYILYAKGFLFKRKIFSMRREDY